MMTQAPLTRDRLRAEIALLLGEDAAAIGDDDNLMDLGLDSLRAMTLATGWSEAGVPLDFADLAEAPTIARLWDIARERLGEGAA